MLKHERFGELCSLAAIGELSGPELNEFMAHLTDCTECQRNYQEFAELASEYIPLATRHSQRIAPSSIQAVRSGVLRRMTSDSLRITPEAMLGPIGFRDRMAKHFDNLRWLVFARRFELIVSSLAVAVLLCAALALRYDRARKSQIDELQGDLALNKHIVTQLEVEISHTTQNRSLVMTDVERLEHQLADVTVRSARLEVEKMHNRAAIASLEADIQRLTMENGTLSQRATTSDADLSSLREQLQQLRARADSKETDLIAARYQVSELSAQLKAQQRVLDQEEKLLAAGRDIRDLMGARNLHIIDVHDMDARGEARPFGRIFLTEGRRLIFYAYDLDSVRAKNATFQAWGQRTDGKQTAVNLGILFMDDRKQSRWALKVEDPSLLSEIDSIFVTVEPHGGTEKPTGKKLMYAYLRNPINHP